MTGWTWLSEPLRDLGSYDLRGRSPAERGQMSKPRTILVPRLRMQRPTTVSEDVVSLLASLEQGLHEVGPQLQCLLGMLEWQTGQKRSTLFINMHCLPPLPAAATSFQSWSRSCASTWSPARMPRLCVALLSTSLLPTPPFTT